MRVFDVSTCLRNEENGRGSTAQVDETGTAEAPGLWGFVAASMIDGETGWKSSLTDGASVL